MTFPYKIISREEAINSYKQLMNTDNALSGSLFTDYFTYKLRVRTKAGNWSKLSAWNDVNERKKIMKNNKKLNPNQPVTDSRLRTTMDMMYGSQIQFKPQKAKLLFKKL